MSTIHKLTKENILALKDSYELLEYYLRPYHNYSSLKQGKHISNPFLSNKQKTPSFNIYKNPSGTWMYKDFAIPDCKGTVFDLVMRLNNCNFYEALQQINADFQLGLQSSITKKQADIFFEKTWNSENAAYWKNYGITAKILNYYKVFPVSKITYYKQNNQPFDILATADDPIFAYEINPSCYKIYRPLSSTFKFSWIGNKSEDYVFGISQLPDTGNLLFITGGEKDVMSLAAHGYWAICFNSETSLPPDGLIQKLKERFQKVVVLYDMDTTGKQQTEKLVKKFQLYEGTLPTLDHKDGKDISDFFKSGYTFSNDTLIVYKPTTPKEQPTGKYLPKLSDISQQLTKVIGTEIQEIPSLITHNGKGIVFAQSIHLIQGKSGTHKSRLAQMLCSTLLKKEECTNTLLGFKATMETPCHVCYVDTERNLAYQLPKALQEIQIDAGYGIMEKPRNFHYTSLVNTPRADRFEALCEYIDFVEQQLTGEHLVVVLDVVSDCVMDFNSTQDSLLLNDKLNQEINKREKQVSFIAVIHENPSQTDGKPRGHLGTEMNNKATFTFRTAFENEKQPETSDLIVIQFPKNRNGKRPEHALLEFCEDTKRLKMVNSNFSNISSVSNMAIPAKKGNLAEIKAFLSANLTALVSGKQLIADLCKAFSCGDRTIRERLKELSSNYFEILNDEQVPCQLIKTQNGREIFYQLKPIQNPTSLLKK